jgi:hypothetical protein
MVGAKGFEPSTSWSRTRRASQAALRPDKLSPTSRLEQFDNSNIASEPETSMVTQHNKPSTEASSLSRITIQCA